MGDTIPKLGTTRLAAVTPLPAKLKLIHDGKVIEEITGTNLMVVAKSIERIGDHATNIAEDVVYLYEGCDIRHSGNNGGQGVVG